MAEPAPTAAPEVITLAEAATRLGVTETWLRNKIRRNSLPHHRLGNHVRFTEDDLAEIIAAGRRRPAEVKDDRPRPSRRSA